MDANYVMDETLGNSSFDITKLRIGQKKTESFLIGKVWDGENIWIMKLYVPLKTRVFQTVCLNSGKVVRHYICMWPVMILYIFPTGNQSVLGDVAGDLVCLWGFTWVAFKNIFFPLWNEIRDFIFLNICLRLRNAQENNSEWRYLEL